MTDDALPPARPDESSRPDAPLRGVDPVSGIGHQGGDPADDPNRFDPEGAAVIPNEAGDRLDQANPRDSADAASQRDPADLEDPAEPASGGGGLAAGAVIGGALGAALGTASLGPPGAVIGAVVGGGVGAMVGRGEERIELPPRDDAEASPIGEEPPRAPRPADSPTGVDPVQRPARDDARDVPGGFRGPDVDTEPDIDLEDRHRSGGPSEDRTV